MGVGEIWIFDTGAGPRDAYIRPIPKSEMSN